MRYRPVFTMLAFELAVGGLDNLLSHHKVATLALAWGGRVLGVSLLIPHRPRCFRHRGGGLGDRRVAEPYTAAITYGQTDPR
jgi:hypothetical protein